MTATHRVVGARRRSRSERTLPFVYLALALGLGVAILPSVLRPPRDQPTTSSGFSPDAPPDKNQASVFSSFQQASSGTPGGVTQQAQQAQVTAPPPPTTVPPPKVVASACPYGFGNPPRQIESVYSPPCAPAF